MNDREWVDVGAVDELAQEPVQEIRIGRMRIAITFKEGEFGALSGVCNHVGGPLGKGTLEGDFVTCPWHFWKFHRTTGLGEPGFEQDAVPRHPVRVAGGRVQVQVRPATKRSRLPHEPHPLAREPQREEGPLRILGISTTAMNLERPRYSTSEDLLETALAHAASEFACATRLLRVRDLRFRACEGFYSKSAHACTWPCSITQMDPDDQMDRVYEGVVHWADVILVATPIRWGSASSLYFKMVERMNCIQNQETIANRQLLHNKVVGLFVTGGQDNIQAVVGQMLGFFSELGCHFPPYPFVAHSRGWSAEDMENNTLYVQCSEVLHEGARALVGRCAGLAQLLIRGALKDTPKARGGRKGHELDTRAQLPPRDPRRPIETR